MKKCLYLVVACFMLFVLAGCDKNKDKNKEKNEGTQIEETIKDLYTDEEKLVYDNGGVYKLVFYFENDDITGLEHYYEYENEAEAKKQYDIDRETLKDNISIKNISLSGKYVIYTMAPEQYEGKKVSEIKNSYSFLLPVYEN